MERLCLKRTGQRPLLFRGALVASAFTPQTATDIRHTLNIYQTEAGAFVVEVHCDQSEPRSAHLWRAEEFDTAAAAADYLRRYRVAHDLLWSEADLIAENTISHPDAAESALSRLHDLMEDCQARFDSLVNDLLAPEKPALGLCA